ncbi:RNA-binding protein, partial [Enterococcus faecium]|uniref:YlmH/Sll1252 family protein n=1 Tax=Enterococcus faecium TaxID=1352 RepID=UPI00113F29FD
YYEPVEEDFETALSEIHYPSKFASLSHGKILVTLVGTGIKRSYFGDIISDCDRWQVFIANEVDHFVGAQVTKIGKVAVRLEPIKY